jgi:polysaccharide export outer membrane protein
VRKVLATLCAAALLVGCAAARVAHDYAREYDPSRHEYVVGISDQLRITVWKNPELSTDATVRPDGTITMPILGDLHAAEQTPTQIREEVRRRLAAFVRDEAAVVTVAVTGVNSYRFTVTGNVEHAGVYTSHYYVSLAEAIAMAGGPNRFASPSETVIVRQEKGGTRKIPVPYDEVRSGDHPEKDLVLVAGDTVFVPWGGRACGSLAVAPWPPGSRSPSP